MRIRKGHFGDVMRTLALVVLVVAVSLAASAETTTRAKPHAAAHRTAKSAAARHRSVARNKATAARSKSTAAKRVPTAAHVAAKSSAGKARLRRREFERDRGVIVGAHRRELGEIRCAREAGGRIARRVERVGDVARRGEHAVAPAEPRDQRESQRATVR